MGYKLVGIAEACNARRTLSCRTPVDSVEASVVPVRPLAEMAAGMVAEYYSEEETRKLAPDFVELIQKTGIKRSSSTKLERAQTKMRSEDMKEKFSETGEPTTGGIGEEEATDEKKPAFDLALVNSNKKTKKQKTKKKTIGGTAPPPAAGDSEEEESSEEAE